ncbi:hypothetical protein MLD38_024116 [Melastoma candidum]|uniref:Uncharacterized protein n=1 Tax=Melastoma candidum TaxID=119954 RepID=A0ACB9NRD3_9MYRT|nr:hypothetical protein MLD38_024116 [Melastoma candidum]
MVSREQKRAAFREKLQVLRSITNSHAMDETEIVLDASNYIQELKHKVERLSRDISVADSSSEQPRLPEVNVETLEKGYLIQVLSDRSCPGLLSSILEAFEELGLNVMEARVSCTKNFQLQAFGGDNEDEGGGGIYSQVIESAVVQAVKNWSENNEK